MISCGRFFDCAPKLAATLSARNDAQRRHKYCLYVCLTQLLSHFGKIWHSNSSRHSSPVVGDPEE